MLSGMENVRKTLEAMHLEITLLHFLNMQDGRGAKSLEPALEFRLRPYQPGHLGQASLHL